MTNEALIILSFELPKLGNLKGVKFAYGIARNKGAAAAEIKIINESQEMTDEYKEYEKERVKLCEQYGKKGEDGKALIINQNYDVTAHQEQFDTELDELNKKNQSAIDERNNQLKEFEKLLKEQSNFVPYKILLADVPTDISTEQLGSIIELIDEK